jgi:hypothetical protein
MLTVHAAAADAIEMINAITNLAAMWRAPRFEGRRSIRSTLSAPWLSLSGRSAGRIAG